MASADTTIKQRGFGETRRRDAWWANPLVVFLGLAVLFLVFLAHDVWKAMWFDDPVTHRVSFGIGVGTIVLAVNVTLLAGYALGCHSMRHLVGGYIDQISRSPVQKKAFDCAS